MLCTTPPGTVVWPNTPQTCIVQCPDGEPFAWTVAAGGTDESTGLIQIPPPNPGGGPGPIIVPELKPLVITTDSNLEGISKTVEGTSIPAFDYAVAVTGGAGNYVWALADPIGSPLPPGLGLATNPVNDSYGDITGSPTMAGSFQTVIKVTDQLGNVASKKFQFRIPEIVKWTPIGGNRYALPNGTAGLPYNAGIAPMTGLPIAVELKALATQGELVWGLWRDSGPLPTGLKLDAKTGIISGVPSEAVITKAWDFTVQLQDNGGVRNYSVVRADFRITVNP